MTKLFVFDLGNVILPFEHRQIGTKLCERSERKATLSPGEIFDFMFNRGTGLINIYETGQMSSLEFFNQLREQFRLSITFEEFKDIWNPIFWENPRVIEAIEYLKSKGFPLFLLSDTNELHFAHIIDQYPNALQHDMPDEMPRTYLAHPVRIVSGTRLFEILGTPLAQVNSLHHQGIKELAPGLVATAYAPDGLVEGVEIPGHRFAVSVQWHPEWMTSYPEMMNLFKAFTEAASRAA